MVTVVTAKETMASTDLSAPGIQVDLQPVRMATDALQGQAAYGRFALSNSGHDRVAGTLKGEGRIKQVLWDESSRSMTVVLDEGLKESAWSRELELSPNEQILIDTVASQPGDAAQGFSLLFEPAGAAPLHAYWSYFSTRGGVSKAFTNASFVEDSPFYLVPVFHTLQRRSQQVSYISDFRFVAAVPMRLEVYDSQSGQLLYIDADGDGDWLDSGDQLSFDQNRNGLPDVLFVEGSLTADIELHFHASPTDLEEPVELRLQLRVGDQWETQCINLIALERP